MHELSIAQAVVSTVRDALPGRRVLSVKLRIGVLAGVVPQALGFAWDLATSGTSLAGSALMVEREPLPGRCLDCDALSSHDRPPPLTCPQCGGRVLPVDAAAGRVMEVASVEVDDDEAPSSATGTGLGSGNRDVGERPGAACGGPTRAGEGRRA
jgi:hydrogenase nickel incorporation protein HypA/HybF